MPSTSMRHVAATVALSALFTVAADAETGAASAPATGASDYAVLQRWKLGGVGGWDYLTFDSIGKRLFVSHATQVDVVSTESGTIVGTVPGTPGVHGIAIAQDLKRGYVSNGKGDSVTVFDLNTLAIIKEVKLEAHNPDAILYEPVGKHVFTFNGKSKDVTVLDATSLAVVTTFAVPDKPEFAVEDGAGHIFFNLESDAGQIGIIDARQLKLTATWALPGCASPSGLAIDKLHHRLFSVCDGKVMAVTDAESGKQVARVPIGEGPDAAAYDAAHQRVFSSNGDGTLTVIRAESADRYRVETTVKTQRGARTMALDAASGKVYLVTADFDPPPAATPEQPHPRPSATPGTFTLIVVGPR
jgi:YVTN family beta-propeller protein